MKLPRVSLAAAFAALILFALPSSRALAADSGPAVVIVPKKADPKQLVSFSFRNADVEDVLRFLADATGKIAFKDPAVRMTLTIRSPRPIPVKRALDLVRTALSFEGYALQETRDALIVTTKAKALLRVPNVAE